MNHPVRFEEALRYPYAEPRRASLVWLPGAVFFVLSAVYLIGVAALVLVVYLTTGEFDEESPTYKIGEAILDLCNFVISFLVSIPMMGYFWRLLGQWREGRETDPPSAWTDRFWGYVSDGFKLMLYYIPATLVSILPFVICAIVVGVFFLAGFNVLSELQAAGYAISVMVVLICIFITLCFSFFVTPYLIAPVVLSAKTRTLKDLFSLSAAWAKASQHYATGLRATGWMIATALVYGVATVFLACSCVGILALPFTTFPYWVTVLHLAHQVFPVDDTPVIPSAVEESPPA